MKEWRGSSESFSERSLLLFLLLEECLKWAVWLFMGFFFSFLLLLLLFEAKLPAGHTKPTMMMTPNSFFSFFLFFSSSYLFYFQSKQFVLYKVEGWSLPGLLPAAVRKKSRSLPGYL